MAKQKFVAIERFVFIPEKKWEALYPGTWATKALYPGTWGPLDLRFHKISTLWHGVQVVGHLDGVDGGNQ